ncbi:hypothetical protein PybrP1_011933 [[Pythium] brassicae (nom. inval.)]|nr:hypothetical protein PybrP1_011933 [[Pythium] brassicae (nom. inval.)]
MRLACLALAAAVALAGTAANTDVPGQLMSFKGSITTAPPVPAALAPGLKKRLGDRALSTLSPALQHALLWDAGQFFTGTASRYVDVYVLCGQTMNNAFLSVSGVSSADCPLKDCKQFTMNFALSECSAASLESRALCAVVGDDRPGGAGAAASASAMSAYTGPLWSQEGNIDASYAPKIYQNPINGTGSLYVISQAGDFAGAKDKCGATPTFVVPCRRVSRTEVTEAFEEKKWCRPQAQLGVDLWYASETSAPAAAATPSAGGGAASNADTSSNSATGSSDSSSNTAAIVLGAGLGVAVLVCIVLLVLLSKRKRAGKEDAAGQPTHSGAGGYAAVAGGGARSAGHDSASTAGAAAFSSVNVETVNDRFRQQSAVLAAFCDDADLMMKRVAFTSLQFQVLVASGANGDVWRGEYQGQTVAGVKSKSMHLLPLISQGVISPRFSDSCPAPILELARACLDQDPDKRPPAMQVVYMLRSKIGPLL